MSFVVPNQGEVQLLKDVLGSGGTAGKGIQLKGDANGTGSDYVVTINAYVKF